MTDVQIRTPKLFKAHIPKAITKQLKVQTVSGKRRLTLSSNWLMLMGFDGGYVVENSMGLNQGIEVVRATEEDIQEKRAKKVYTREYTSRSANPLNPTSRRKERLVQISRQKLINESLGSANRVHIQISYNRISFKPIFEGQLYPMPNESSEDKISSLVAMTGGVDCHLMEKHGFSISTVIEYRPNEKRDSADYTEMTSMSVLANSKPDFLINEDIYNLDLNRLAKLVGQSKTTFAHFSLQCDDYSTLKTNKQKSDSVLDMSSTLDMFLPMLSVLDALKIPTLLVENVPGFMSSAINDVVVLQLKRRGYKVYQDVFDAREFDSGNTGRKRMYMFATMLNSEFSFPEPSKNVSDVWNDIILPNWDEIQKREVTNSSVVRTSLTSGRARIIKEGDKTAPTLTKAQGQDTKDAVVIEKDNRFYRLPVVVQKMLNSIPSSFDIDWMPLDKAAQIIGQSICCKLHGKILDSVKNHIINARRESQLGLIH